MKNSIKITPELEASFTRCAFEGNKLVMPDPSVCKFDNWPAMKKVFDALGGKWNKKEKAVVFPSDAKALLLPAVESGGVLDKKKHFQFFPTPVSVAQEMLLWFEPSMADRQKFEGRVLEPSAGKGSLANTVMIYLPHCRLDCVEIQEDFREVLKNHGRNVIGSDFLKMPKSSKYDAIFMNPPFQDGQDIKHVLHAYGFLKPGGCLVSIMARGVTTNDYTAPREFRAFVTAKGGDFMPIPPGAFKESGTNVNTVMVNIVKPR